MDFIRARNIIRDSIGQRDFIRARNITRDFIGQRDFIRARNITRDFMCVCPPIRASRSEPREPICYDARTS